MSNPTPTRRDGEATRQRLLRAALDLYTTVGFRATTTPAIAARAGVAEGTIYRHFSGKEHLLNEVYRNAQRWGAGLVKEAEPNGNHSVSQRLETIARSLLDAAARDPSLTRMLLRSRDEQHLDERSREAAREFRDALRQVVAAGESQGLVRQGPPRMPPARARRRSTAPAVPCAPRLRSRPRRRPAGARPGTPGPPHGSARRGAARPGCGAA
ncbi:MAG TPA: TetR/AcrR family transcriptional regulator, partial [Gemmatimonadales bacterium]|nr:TetR/AcrR family transcriptional regulator [Gemmatimonadales bacterium]